MVHNGESWLNMVNNWNNVGKTMSQTTQEMVSIPPMKMLMTGVWFISALPTLISWSYVPGLQ